ncbi:hypothetical protein XA68_11594 [Ophiocordyceps unilateralis]|uniref:C2H2-type domain-containing protein n=1 Tax=Ophiocordyceps unilateralis TaxID=268505 RepID=A0A2A9PGI0_OPHUN|nr:hypothetical protein XA68_11594 [Ophiocordyceps unilateralis]
MSTSKASGSRDIRRYFGANAQQANLTPNNKRSSPPGSADEEDPLFGDSAGLRPPRKRPEIISTQSSNATMATTTTSTLTAGRTQGSRLAVMLAASPRTRARASSSPATQPTRRHRAVTSDAILRQTGRQLGQESDKETPVPLPKLEEGGLRSVATTTVSTPDDANSRGRPKGWRAGMSYSAMRGRSPPGTRARKGKTRSAGATAYVGMAKRRGRQAKPPSPPPREIYHRLRPQFVQFLCEWDGCKAELHNLETLRRHVYAVHGGSPFGCCCRWGKCADTARALATVDDFRHHVEEAHLVPMSWHMGDGPRNSGGQGRDRRHGAAGGDDDDDDDEDDDEEEIPDYLKDAQGVQVTPSIRDQEVEDVLTWRMNRRKLKELLIRRDENLPDEESESPDDEA